ncbi:hypothetical protein J4214_04755 [Candidatus Woesearchaeota archaeon]|nr:hypothetical protein [Candidatus Woesearchaeota archaeon]
MYNIILDTSFILTAIKFRIDIFLELERICIFNHKISVIDKTLHELKNKPNGKLALDLIEKKNVNIIKPSEKGIVDDILTKLAGGDKDIIIATQDMDLKKRLKNSRIITIKQKKYLILTN